MPTYIDGIASSQAIDTAGEIVDIAGLDISSLAGAVFNWEHMKDVPDQLVGKVLECKKIFLEKDCENERHSYYWNKCQIPFLYVMGRLFDDKKPSSIEVAALFKDDAEHPNEQDMLGFSIEGSKLSKEGMIVTKSIARKVTITNIPANKTCIAEMVPAKKDSKTDIDSLFKTESVEVEFFTPNKEFVEFLEKKEKEMNKVAPLSGGAPTSSMFASELKKDQPMLRPPAGPKPSKSPKDSDLKSKRITSIVSVSSIASTGNTGAFGSGLSKSASPSPTLPSGWTHVKDSKSPGVHFSHPEHGTLSAVKQSNGQIHVKMGGKIVGYKGVSGIHHDVGNAGKHMHGVMHGISSGKLAPPKMHNIPSASSSGSKFTKSDLNKALEAGSGIASPGMLVQGAALSVESLDRKIKKIGSKSHWLARAEEEYERWDKKEHFRSFMKKKLPNLSKGEIDAIGRVIALNKALKAEKLLAKMLGNESFQGSFIPKSEEMDKTTDILMASDKDKK